MINWDVMGPLLVGFNIGVMFTVAVVVLAVVYSQRLKGGG